MKESAGVLALWNDCADGQRQVYERWYQTEHLAERMSIPGFVCVRRFESGDLTAPRFFTYYAVKSPAVLQSASYRQRVDNPTALTQRVMGGVLCNMNRSVCQVIASHGDVHGAWAVTVRMQQSPASPEVSSWLSTQSARLARWQLWQALDRAKEAPPSREERLRGGDQTTAACLLVETLRLRDALELRQNLASAAWLPAATVGHYHLLCELR